MRKSSIRMFLAEVFSRVLQEQEPNIDKFAFLFTSVLAFEHADQHTENFHLQCLLGLAKRLGFGVHNASELYHQVYGLERRTGTALGLAHADEMAALQALIDQPYFTSVPMPNQVRRSVLDAILLYYKIHIDNMPEIKSLDVLHTLFQ
jgi:DNA repair protein RecO (recombination protein O)